MSQYVDSSALVKRYVNEPDTAEARALLLADTEWVTANHTYPEVYRTLARRLSERDLPEALAMLDDDWHRMIVVSLDDEVCRRAGLIATVTGTRTLDALHLAATERAGGHALPFLTFDIRQAVAARSLGFPVLGA